MVFNKYPSINGCTDLLPQQCLNYLSYMFSTALSLNGTLYLILQGMDHELREEMIGFQEGNYFQEYLSASQID